MFAKGEHSGDEPKTDPTAQQGTTDGPGVQMLCDLIGKGKPAPSAVVNIIDTHPDETEAILTELQQSLGNDYTQLVIDALDKSSVLDFKHARVSWGSPEDPNGNYMVGGVDMMGGRMSLFRGGLYAFFSKDHGNYRIGRDGFIQGLLSKDGATFDVGHGTITGKAGNDGVSWDAWHGLYTGTFADGNLDSKLRVGGKDDLRFDYRKDPKELSLGWDHGGVDQGALFGRFNTGGKDDPLQNNWQAGIRRPWQLGPQDHLNTELRMQGPSGLTQQSAFVGAFDYQRPNFGLKGYGGVDLGGQGLYGMDLSRTYKHGWLNASANGNYQGDHFAFNNHNTFGKNTFGEGLTFGHTADGTSLGTQFHQGFGTKTRLDENASWSWNNDGNVTPSYGFDFQRDYGKSSTFSFGASNDGTGQHGYFGNTNGIGDKSFSERLTFDHTPTSNSLGLTMTQHPITGLSLSETMGWSRDNTGHNSAVFGFEESYRSKYVQQSLETHATVNNGSFDMTGKGSIDAQLLPQLFMTVYGDWASATDFTPNTWSAGGSFTGMMQEKMALTAALQVQNGGKLEGRIQFDVFKKAIESLGDLNSQRKSQLISVFFSLAYGPNPGVLDDRFGAGDHNWLLGNTNAGNQNLTFGAGLVLPINFWKK